MQIPGRTVLVGLRGQRDVAEKPRRGEKRLRWMERFRGPWNPSSCEAPGPAHVAMLPMCPPPPTSSHLSKEDALLGRSLMWEKPQQLIPWNTNQQPGVACAGGTEVWQPRGGYSSAPPNLPGYPCSSNVGLPAKAAAPARVCSACQLLRRKAELPVRQQPLLHLLPSSHKTSAASEGRLHY